MNHNELIAIYIDRFINQTKSWGKQWVSADGSSHGYYHQKPDMDTKGGKYLYEPVTIQLVQRHFEGKVTCSWAAIDENYCSKWLCFDSDVDKGDLDQLQEKAESWGLHIIRESRRLNRAGHLWILFDQPVKAEYLIVLGDAMIQLAGVHLKTKDFPDGIERFPVSANAYSQVRGPLGINLKPEANMSRGWFDGVEQDIDAQLNWLAVQPLNNAEDAIREAKKHKVIVMPASKLLPNSQYWHNDYQPFNILEYVNYRKVGNEYVAQCPLCADEGHDRHKDNLKIKLDGSTFCCVYGGPGQIHHTQDIKAFLLGAKQL
jgi:hypothetical protein